MVSGQAYRLKKVDLLVTAANKKFRITRLSIANAVQNPSKRNAFKKSKTI
tara:strand:+ start:1621 stop:1770 length:150 start_codon:yes stop_codon:yes gene_type:complete